MLDNLIALPLDMKQFQTAQENFVEKAVRSSFFIPIICFAVVLIYGFFFREHSSEKGRGRKACPGMNQLHITYARYENSITNHRYPPHD